MHNIETLWNKNGRVTSLLCGQWILMNNPICERIGAGQKNNSMMSFKLLRTEGLKGRMCQRGAPINEVFGPTWYIKSKKRKSFCG